MKIDGPLPKAVRNLIFRTRALKAWAICTTTLVLSKTWRRKDYGRPKSFPTPMHFLCEGLCYKTGLFEVADSYDQHVDELKLDISRVNEA